jgi:hypothetical protein
MRGVIQLLFLVFYVGSSYVTTQYRVTSVVHKLQRSNARDNQSTLESCKQSINCTRFREAKKAVTDFSFRTDATPTFALRVSERQFAPQTSFYKSQFDVEARHSRAPPTISAA